MGKRLKALDNASALASLVKVLAIVAFLLQCSFLVLLGLMDGTWENWKQATCMPDKCFCEQPRGTLLQQPTDTWSNMMFSLAGVVILFLTATQLEYHDVKKGVSTLLQNVRSRSNKNYWFYASVYGVALNFLGFGSAFYHASLTFWGQFIDNIGMYLIICWAFAYNMVRLNPKEINRVVFFVIYGGLIVVFGLINIYLPDIRRFAFFGMVLLYIISQYVVDRIIKPVIYYRYWAAALGSLATGFLFWIMDNNHHWCAPTSLLQGHGVWHSLDALASFFIFVFYLSEDYQPEEYDTLHIGDLESLHQQSNDAAVEQDTSCVEELKETSPATPIAAPMPIISSAPIVAMIPPTVPHQAMYMPTSIVPAATHHYPMMSGMPHAPYVISAQMYPYLQQHQQQ